MNGALVILGVMAAIAFTSFAVAVTVRIASTAVDGGFKQLFLLKVNVMGKFEDLQAQEAATAASAEAIIATVNKVLAAQLSTAAQLADAQAALASLQAQVQAMGGVDPAKYDAMTADLATLKSKLDAAVAIADPPPPPAPVPMPDPAPPAAT